jgi:hypothetical protein
VKLWNIPALVPASALSTLETWSAVRTSTCSRSRPSKSKLMRASLGHRSRTVRKMPPSSSVTAHCGTRERCSTTAGWRASADDIVHL